LCGFVPSFAGPHAPSAPFCFSDARHAWQRPVHAVSQQTPSTQATSHMPQSAVLQSTAGLHAAAFCFFGWQVPFAEQYCDAAQLASDVQLPGHCPFTPSHTNPPHEGFAPVAPFARTLHVPVASHTSHPPLHGALQQTPSAQLPERHEDEREQACPWRSLQAPCPLHVLVTAQVLGSSAFVTVVHAPVVGAHVLHVPPHAVAQQNVSSQTPERQSSFVTHVTPAARTS